MHFSQFFSIHHRHHPLIFSLGFISEKIALKIKRTAVSRRTCNYPLCQQKNGLKTISKEFRYVIAVNENVFVPSRSVACANHIKTDAWKHVNQLIEPEYHEYNDEYLVDMFQLLSNPPKKNTETRESRMYKYNTLHTNNV